MSRRSGRGQPIRQTFLRNPAAGVTSVSDGATSTLVLVASGSEAIADQGTTTFGLVSSGAEAIADTSTRGYLKLASGDGATTPYNAALNSTTQVVDLRARVRPDTWGAALQGVFGDFGGGAGRWWLGLQFGSISVSWLKAGGGSSSAQAFSAVPFADGVTGWIRVVFDPVAGTADFYSSYDGSTWTATGPQITGLGTAGLNVPSGSPIMQVGADTGGAYSFAGRIYRVQALIAASPVLDMAFVGPSTGGPWISQSTGETWTAVVSGAVVADQLDTLRLAATGTAELDGTTVIAHIVASATQGTGDAGTSTAVLVPSGTEAVADAGTTTLTLASSGAETVADAGTSTAVIVPGFLLVQDSGTTTLVVASSGIEAIADVGTATGVVVTSGAEALADAGTTTVVVVPSEADAEADAGTATAVLVTSGSEAVADAATSTAVVVVSGVEKVADVGTSAAVIVSSGSEALADAGSATMVVPTSGTEAIADAGTTTLSIASSGTEAVADAGTSTAVIVSGSGVADAIDAGSVTATIVTSGSEAIADAGSATLVIATSGAEAVADAATSTLVIAASGVTGTQSDLGGPVIVVPTSGAEAIADAGTATFGVASSGTEAIADGLAPILDIGDAFTAVGMASGAGTTVTATFANDVPVGTDIWLGAGATAAVNVSFSDGLGNVYAMILTGGNTIKGLIGHCRTTVFIPAGTVLTATFNNTSTSRFLYGRLYRHVNRVYLQGQTGSGTAATSFSFTVASQTLPHIVWGVAIKDSLSDFVPTNWLELVDAATAAAEFEVQALVRNGFSIETHAATWTGAAIYGTSELIATGDNADPVVVITPTAVSAIADAGTVTISLTTSGTEAIADGVPAITDLGDAVAAVVASTSGTTLTGTFAQDIPADVDVWVAIGNTTQVNVTLSDGLGNVYVFMVQGATLNGRTFWYRCHTNVPIPAGTSLIASFNNTGTSRFLYARAYRNVRGVPAQATGSAGTGTSISSGNSFGAQASAHLDLGVVMKDSASDIAPVSWVEIAEAATAAVEYEVQALIVRTATAGETFGATWTPSANWIQASVIATGDTANPIITVTSTGPTQAIADAGSVTFVLSTSGTEALADAGSTAGIVVTSGTEALADAGSVTAFIQTDSAAIADAGTTTITILTGETDAEADVGSSSLQVVTSGAESVADLGTTTIAISSAATQATADAGSSSLQVSPTGTEAIADRATTAAQIAVGGLETLSDAGQAVFVVTPSAAAQSVADAGTCVIGVSTPGAEAIGDAGRTQYAVLSTGFEALGDAGTSTVVLISGSNTADSGTTVLGILTSGEDAIADAGSVAFTLSPSGAEGIADAGTCTISIGSSGVGVVQGIIEFPDAGTAVISVTGGGYSSGPFRPTQPHVGSLGSRGSRINQPTGRPRVGVHGSDAESDRLESAPQTSTLQTS